MGFAPRTSAISPPGGTTFAGAPGVPIPQPLYQYSALATEAFPGSPVSSNVAFRVTRISPGPRVLSGRNPAYTPTGPEVSTEAARTSREQVLNADHWPLLP